ncbi:hypothetical protein Tco_1200215 [Tanacetum coccineum]
MANSSDSSSAEQSLDRESESDEVVSEEEDEVSKETQNASSFATCNFDLLSYCLQSVKLSSNCSKYEIGESSTARSTRGRGIDYGFVNTVDAEERRQGIRDVRLQGLLELHEHDTQDLYALLEDAQDREVWMVGGGGEATMLPDEAWAQLDRIESGDPYPELRTPPPPTCVSCVCHKTHLRHIRHSYSYRAQMVETLRVMRDIRREMDDMQTELLALRGQRRARQPAPDARIPDHHDASGDVDSHV